MKIIACSLCLCLFGCGKYSSIDHNAVSYNISPNGKQITFSSASGDLFLLDISTQRIEQITKTPDIESSPAFSPDGTFILFASATLGKSESCIFRLSIRDEQTKQLTSEDNVYDASPSYFANGSKIDFARAPRYRTYSTGGKTWDDWDIYTMNADGTNVVRTTNQKYRTISQPQFGADGQAIYFSSRIKRQDSSRYSAIFKVSITEEPPQKNLTPDDQNIIGCAAVGSEPAVSPDGTKLVFISDRKTKYEYDLFVMNLDGSNPTPLNLTGISKYNAIPRFSPSGKEVFFLAESEKNANSQPLFSLWAADATGKNPYRIAKKELFNEPLQWGPRDER